MVFFKKIVLHLLSLWRLDSALNALLQFVGFPVAPATTFGLLGLRFAAAAVACCASGQDRKRLDNLGCSAVVGPSRHADEDTAQRFG